MEQVYPKVHASAASPTTSPQHAATASPAAVPRKELILFLCLTVQILRGGLSTITPYLEFKEPRYLFPIRLLGTESGLESHPYWKGLYLFRSYFAMAADRHSSPTKIILFWSRTSAGVC
jgi:hypothetical protein